MSGLGFVGDRLFDADEERFREEFSAWLDAHPPPVGEVSTPGAIEVHRAWQGIAAAAGYGALHWPVEHGGADLPLGHQVVAQEELARRHFDHKLLMASLYFMGPLLMTHGTDAQRERHLGPILRGEEHWCQLLSEPDAGSDLTAIRTRADRDGDDLVVNGHKVWSSYAHLAHRGLLVCRTEPGSVGKRGISLVALDLATPGITMRPIRQMDDVSHFNEVFFDDVRIGADQVIGPLHEGWGALLSVLGSARSSLTLSYYAEFVAALLERPRPDPSARRRYLDVWMGLAVQRLTSLRAGSGATPSLGLASLGKLQATHNRKALADLVLAEVGAAAMAAPAADDDATAARAGYLESPGFSLGGGTTEVQRNVVAEHLLGLPREPHAPAAPSFRR